VVPWELITTAAFDQWFDTLTSDEQIEVAAKIELLRHYGPTLRRPHADTLAGSKYSNMKELRGKTATAILRIAFAFDPNRLGVVLIGGQKQGVNPKRFYKALIAIADKLFGEHLKSLQK
jgi:hypothetical protein